MKKTFLSMTIIVFLLLCSNGVQAQNATNDLDQLKLAQKYWVGTWQGMMNDTTFIWEMKQDGNVIIETDYIIVNGKKSIDSYWNYSYKPERNNFYIFGALIRGGYMTLIGSFTADNKWIQKAVENFNPDKVVLTVEFVFDSPTNVTVTAFNKDGTKMWESKATKVK